jgi:hypothetical protein
MISESPLTLAEGNIYTRGRLRTRIWPSIAVDGEGGRSRERNGERERGRQPGWR